MGNTYAMVNERKKEWLRQWAKIMLIVEQSVSRKERLAQQWNYSKKMPDGSRVLVTRLIQTVGISFGEIYIFFSISKSDEREGIESMRNDYYNQIRRRLEPENASQQSKTKSIAAVSQMSTSVHPNGAAKLKQDAFRNQAAHGSFNSFDTTALLDLEKKS